MFRVGIRIWCLPRMNMKYLTLCRQKVGQFWLHSFLSPKHKWNLPKWSHGPFGLPHHRQIIDVCYLTKIVHCSKSSCSIFAEKRDRVLQDKRRIPRPAICSPNRSWEGKRAGAPLARAMRVRRPRPSRIPRRRCTKSVCVQRSVRSSAAFWHYSDVVKRKRIG